MGGTKPIVYVVDDDPEMCESLKVTLSSVGLAVETYPSCQPFLDSFHFSFQPACLVVDVRLPDVSGLALYRLLKTRGCELPLIFITGYPETDTAVEAMREGAVDFLVKPFSRQRLLDRVQEAISKAQEWIDRLRVATRFEQTMHALNVRERQVLEGLLSGKEAKQIAGQLGITAKSVLRYRARILERFNVANLVQLVQLARQAEWGAGRAASPLPKDERARRTLSCPEQQTLG